MKISSLSSSTSRSCWFLSFVSCSLVLLINVVNHAGVAQASHNYLGRELASLQKASSSSSPSSIRNQPLYPAYHFRPLRNWINDPNGPMFYKGYYHLFYQYNPKGSVWGNIVWAHSISKDLINWEGLEPAIAPSEPFDKYGTWSGSATFLGNGYKKPAILYTGIINSTNNHQVQVLAFPAHPSDPLLRKWVKPAKYNPVITPDPDINVTNFRDPTTAWWNNGHWKVSVSGSNQRKRGIAYLYRSTDFKNWVRAKHPLHSAPNTGNWECPDFFPVLTTGEKKGLDTSVFGNKGIKHVLKISLDKTRYDYYTLGTYDTDKDIYKPDDIYVDGWDGLRFDYGNFYASKTFYDQSKNRRILLGWANESDSTAQDIAKGWAGIHVIPRTVWFDPKTKQIVQEPVEELKTLRYGQVKMEKRPLATGKRIEIKGITTYQADVEVVFSLPKSLDKAERFDPKWTNAQHLCGLKGSNVPGGVGPFGLFTLATQDLEEYTPIFFRIFKSNDKHVVLLCSDATRSSLDEETYKPSFAGFVNVDLSNRKLSLRSLIDRSVVESFGAGGKTVITSRVYPTKALLDKAHLYAFNNGKETITVETLSAWSMKRPKMMDNQL